MLCDSGSCLRVSRESRDRDSETTHQSFQPPPSQIHRKLFWHYACNCHTIKSMWDALWYNLQQQKEPATAWSRNPSLFIISIPFLSLCDQISSLKSKLTDTEIDCFCLLAEQKYNLKGKQPAELRAQSYENLETSEGV